MLILLADDITIVVKYATDIGNLLVSLKEETGMHTEITKSTSKKFSFASNRAIKTFLEVSMDETSDSFHLFQNHLIDTILDVVSLSTKESFSRNTRDTLVAKPLLLKDKTGDKRILQLNYRSVTGMPHYLAGSTHPDILIAMY